jgi:hypothetical protein
MSEPVVMVNIQATKADSKFDPCVNELRCDFEVFFSIQLTSVFHTVLVTRERLHQLSAVLAKACDKWPLEQPEIDISESLVCAEV